MMRDPYSPGSIPSYLAGRGPELDHARRALGPVTLGRSAGPLLAYSGARGVGKTSLMRAAQAEAEAGEFLTAWVTARADEHLIVGLANALAAQLREVHLESRSKILSHRIDKVRVEVGVPGAKVAADLDTSSRSEAPAGLEELLEDTARFARNHDRHGLIVFVDELQDAPLDDRKSLLIALQHFDGSPDPCPIAVMAAGLPMLPAAVTEAATFGERSHFVTLGRLEAVAVVEALRVPAQEQGIGWSDEAIDAVVAESAGYAYMVQLLGSAAWTAAAPRAAGEQIRLPHVRQALGQVEERMSTLFAVRLGRATGEERRLLLAMAATVDEAGISSRAAAAEHLTVDTKALSRPRQSLIDKGLIEPVGRGRLQFTIPGFDRYLLEVDEDL